MVAYGSQYSLCGRAVCLCLSPFSRCKFKMPLFSRRHAAGCGCRHTISKLQQSRKPKIWYWYTHATARTRLKYPTRKKQWLLIKADRNQDLPVTKRTRRNPTIGANQGWGKPIRIVGPAFFPSISAVISYSFQGHVVAS